MPQGKEHRPPRPSSAGPEAQPKGAQSPDADTTRSPEPEGPPPPRVDSYAFGRIVIDGETYTSDVVITPGGVRPDWWRDEGHSLSLGDLGKVLDDPPDVLIIGTGAHGVMTVPDDVAEAIRDRDVELVIGETGAAVETYRARSKASRTVAALHLTC